MRRIILMTAVAALLVSTNAAAQSAKASSEKTGTEATKADAPKSGFRADFLSTLDDLEKKCVSLAEAVPADKYSWRPAEGVRSVGEVYMHIAAGNYSISGAAGNKAPAGVDPRSFEKMANDKAKTVETLKQSFAHVRETAMKTSDADLDKPTKLFGSDSTVRNALFQMEIHQSEHLGQSIAYARSIGVVPPWTAERQAAQKKKEAESKK
jgi:uncharacterized damage-inducible protein DinB